jgi:transposase InsO family protein
MDFIIALSPAVRRRKVYNALLIIIDRFSKIIQYIAYLKEIDALDIGDRLIETIFSRFSKPRSIVSDRGSTFTSKY